MDYNQIKTNKDKYKISEQLYQCPICSKHLTNRCFLSHVRCHLVKRNLINFKEQTKKNSEQSHINSIEQYNKNPNICLCCGKPILAQLKDSIYRIKVKKFCNQSCATKYSNLHRNKSVYKKISQKLIGKDRIKSCKCCGKQFHAKCNRQVFCSKQCKQIGCGTKDGLIKDIKKFVEDNGYLPTSKMNHKWSRLSKKHFGSWNKMIQYLGYKPNKQKYCKNVYKFDILPQLKHVGFLPSSPMHRLSVCLT